MNSSDYILKNGAKRLRIRKYLGFCIKMVRKGNKYLDLVLKWCEKEKNKIVPKEKITAYHCTVVVFDLLSNRSCC